MDIIKTKDNDNKDKKPKYFNCNIYRYVVKFFRKPKKEKETRKCYEYNKVEYLIKNCRLEQKMKSRSIHEELGNEDKEDNNKGADFVKDSKQVQYDKLLYIVIP